MRKRLGSTPPASADEPWYRGDFPARDRNEITPLIHGDEYFADLVQALRSAKFGVTIAAWVLTPKLSLDHKGPDGGTLLLDELAAAAERIDVRVLLWAGAPMLFQPDAKTARAAQRELKQRAPRIHVALDTTAPFSHDHHQKAVTVDGRVAYVGGIDLTSFQGDRFDTWRHPLRFGIGWHDLQARLEGPVVQDVATNFFQRWEAATGEERPPGSVAPEPTGSTRAQIVRTIPSNFKLPFAPEGHYGIRHALLAAIGRAKRLVYLETQYLWSPEIVSSLCQAMDRDAGMRVVVVLPAKAYDGRYDNDDHVELLRRHDSGRGRFEAFCLYSHGPGESPTGHAYGPIYVHAKCALVDDEWAIVGSANLNERGLEADSEIAVQVNDPELATRLRIRLWAEHLGIDEAEIAAREPVELIDSEWKRRGRESARLQAAGEPGPPWHVHTYVASRSLVGRLLDRAQSASLEH